jgi:hypothetical protein
MEQALHIYTVGEPAMEALAEKVEGIGIRDLPAVKIPGVPRGGAVTPLGPPTVTVEGMAYPLHLYLAALLFADIHEVRYEVEVAPLKTKGDLMYDEMAKKKLKKAALYGMGTAAGFGSSIAANGLQQFSTQGLNDLWTTMTTGGGPTNG